MLCFNSLFGFRKVVQEEKQESLRSFAQHPKLRGCCSTNGARTYRNILRYRKIPLVSVLNQIDFVFSSSVAVPVVFDVTVVSIWLISLKVKKEKLNLPCWLLAISRKKKIIVSCHSSNLC